MSSKKDSQNGNEQNIDQHPRPSRAGGARTTAAAASAGVAAATGGANPCAPSTITTTGSNGDEKRFKGDDGKPNYIGNFHKGLPHNGFGEVDPAAYQTLLDAQKKKKDFDKIQLGLGRKLTNPQSGLATDLEGPDPKDLEIRSAPSLDSAEEAAEGVELYWMALLRDVPFTKFATDPGIAKAAAELSTLTDFTGPKVSGQVTAQTIFRGCSQGDLAGPFISQYLLQDIGYGSLTINQRQKTVQGEATLGAGKADYLTKFNDWLAAQNGQPTFPADKFDLLLDTFGTCVT
jgi:hypothetical protein